MNVLTADRPVAATGKERKAAWCLVSAQATVKVQLLISPFSSTFPHTVQYPVNQISFQMFELMNAYLIFVQYRQTLGYQLS